MEYTLMHKNIPVLNLNLDDVTGHILKIKKIYNIAHIPVGVSPKNRADLDKWWIGRSIPISRSGIKDALEILDVHTPEILISKCFGLSLSDQYWIKPKEKDINWDEVNFFYNDFSEDIGNVLVGKVNSKGKDFSFSSPDNTSDGCLKKRWKIINGKRCLLKAGSGFYNQQPFNEKIASLIAEKLNIPHVSYDIIWDNNEPYSICEDFVTPDTELVTAFHVKNMIKKKSPILTYESYLNYCETVNIKGIQKAIDQMLVLDYIIANEDRHLNNFGLIRDANTLKWIGVAPIFDSGSSLFFNTRTSLISEYVDVRSKPFRNTHEYQIDIVKNIDWIDFSKLNGIENEISKIIDEAKWDEDERKNKIIKVINRRIDKLKQYYNF